MLFVLPIVAFFLALSAVYVLDLWEALAELPSARRLFRFHTALGLFVGVVGAVAACDVQKLIARASLSPSGHFLVCWPAYLGAAWVIWNWHFVPSTLGPTAVSGAHKAVMYSLTLGWCTALGVHLLLMWTIHRVSESRSSRRSNLQSGA